MKKDCQPKIMYLLKIFFKNKVEVKIFSDIGELSKFITPEKMISKDNSGKEIQNT